MTQLNWNMQPYRWNSFLLPLFNITFITINIQYVTHVCVLYIYKIKKAGKKKTYPSWPKARMDALCNYKKKWYAYKNSQAVKKCAALKSQGEKRCGIKGGGKEMVVMDKIDNSGEFNAQSQWNYRQWIIKNFAINLLSQSFHQLSSFFVAF